jgi:hypothetical protein
MADLGSANVFNERKCLVTTVIGNAGQYSLDIGL